MTLVSRVDVEQNLMMTTGQTYQCSLENINECRLVGSLKVTLYCNFVSAAKSWNISTVPDWQNCSTHEELCRWELEAAWNHCAVILPIKLSGSRERLWSQGTVYSSLILLQTLCKRARAFHMCYLCNYCAHELWIVNSFLKIKRRVN